MVSNFLIILLLMTDISKMDYQMDWENIFLLMDIIKDNGCKENEMVMVY